MKTTVYAIAMLLGLAACGTPNAVYCPQGYDTAGQCHRSGDHADRPDRSAPSKGESEDRGEQDSPQ